MKIKLLSFMLSLVMVFAAMSCAQAVEYTSVKALLDAHSLTSSHITLTPWFEVHNEQDNWVRKVAGNTASTRDLNDNEHYSVGLTLDNNTRDPIYIQAVSSVGTTGYTGEWGQTTIEPGGWYRWWVNIDTLWCGSEKYTWYINNEPVAEFEFTIEGVIEITPWFEVHDEQDRWVRNVEGNTGRISDLNAGEHYVIGLTYRNGSGYDVHLNSISCTGKTGHTTTWDGITIPHCNSWYWWENFGSQNVSDKYTWYIDNNPVAEFEFTIIAPSIN